MKDPEFIQLRNRFLFAILIAVIFSIPLIIFLSKNFSDTNVLSMVRKCNLCKKVDDLLEDNSVNYVRLNRDKNKDYDKILKDLGLVNKREEYPIIVYVVDGKMVANLFNITHVNDVKEFIINYDLINSK